MMVAPYADSGLEQLTSLEDAALAYARQGLSVIPLHSPIGGRCDCRRQCSKPAKYPRTLHGLSDATTDETTIRRWWGIWPTANVGLVLPRDMVAVDVDVADPTTVLNGRKLVETACVRTARGWHYLYRTSEPIRPGVAVLPHVDLRGPGSYIVAPPSTHVTGVQYRWDVPLEQGIADAPAWIGTSRKASIEITRPVPVPDRIPVGQRNDRLASIAGTMRARNVTLAAIEAALLVMNRDQMEAPLPENEVRAIARSISRHSATAGMESPPLIGLALEEFLAESTAGVQWMLDQVIVEGALVAIVGRPESFKTMGMLDLGLVGAGAAEAWLEIGIGQARPLVYVSNEKAGATVRERFRRMTLDREPTAPVHIIHRKGVTFGDRASWDAVVATVGSFGRPCTVAVDTSPVSPDRASTRTAARTWLSQPGPAVD
jgi:hypothetical protein